MTNRDSQTTLSTLEIIQDNGDGPISIKIENVVNFNNVTSKFIIGDYIIQTCQVRKGSKPPFVEENCLWIENKDGEGMSISPWMLHHFFKTEF